MQHVVISDQFKQTCPQLAFGLISCSVTNSASHSGLWQEIATVEAEFKATYSIEQINKIPTIQATRQAYKAFGKDSNRYRPSAEALCRRILKGMELYRINTLVDLINLVSIRTGYSIGGFDEDKIVGDITLTVGTADDVFEGIGRGLLNIEGLPVYKDSVGGIGTPTSDNERTKLSMETTRLFMIINGYSGKAGLQEAIDYSIGLLDKYANATGVEVLTL
ncbi:MAG: phenylalanine--tRNA ligase beta subunit-related protein [Paludibacteraceae bacterium]|nr:phenylalanine--tRNA ligase beta subunit-related protein [Paludibacteraceae bacterium]